MAIYLDHASTVPMPREVVDVYTEALGLIGNPSSIHTQGRNAKRMLEDAREAIAGAVDADSVEVVFTSGGTEAVNLALKGLFWARAPRRRILVSRAEHHATIDSVRWLAEHEGAVIDWVPVDAMGRIDVEYLKSALDDDVALVSLLWANNEVGTVQPVAEAVRLAERWDVPVHSDAISAFGYLPVDFRSSGLAAMSISAHKVGGPVGVGALIMARSASLTPLQHGGNQQRARSGTQDAASASAFAAAARSAMHALNTNSGSLAELRDRLVAGVLGAVPGATLRGDPVDRHPGNAHFTFLGCEGDSLLFLLDAAGFSISTGSACQAGVPEASHVLLAMGLSEADARGAVRVSLGRTSTDREVDAFIAALPAAVERARAAGYSDRVPVLGR